MGVPYQLYCFGWSRDISILFSFVVNVGVWLTPTYRLIDSIGTFLNMFDIRNVISETCIWNYRIDRIGRKRKHFRCLKLTLTSATEYGIIAYNNNNEKHPIGIEQWTLNGCELLETIFVFNYYWCTKSSLIACKAQNGKLYPKYCYYM